MYLTASIYLFPVTACSEQMYQTKLMNQYTFQWKEQVLPYDHLLWEQQFIQLASTLFAY